MNIWFLEIGEPLPLESGVRLHRYGQFTNYLTQKGHQVTWWTSSFSHAPKRHIVDETSIHFVNPNLRLYALKGLGYGRNVSFRRFQHQAHFAKQFLKFSENEKPPDVIVAPIPTLEGSEAAAKYAVSHKVPYVVDIRDCWPEEIVSLLPGPFRFLGPILFAGLYKKINFICRNAKAITGVSTSYVDYGLQFSGRKKQSLDFKMPIGYKPEVFSDDSVQNEMQWLKELGIQENTFLVSFFGTIGRYFDLQSVIEAARGLQDTPIQFLLAGEGSSLAKFKKQARGLKNVIFPGWINEEQIQAALRKSMVGLAPYKIGALMAMPNKPFEYMSAGLPVVYSFKGELADELGAAEAGIFYVANQPQQLQAALLKLLNTPDLRKKMGQNAKALFAEKYSMDIIFPQFEALLQNVARQR